MASTGHFMTIVWFNKETVAELQSIVDDDDNINIILQKLVETRTKHEVLRQTRTQHARAHTNTNIQTHTHSYNDSCSIPVVHSWMPFAPSLASGSSFYPPVRHKEEGYLQSPVPWSDYPLDHICWTVMRETKLMWATQNSIICWTILNNTDRRVYNLNCSKQNKIVLNKTEWYLSGHSSVT